MDREKVINGLEQFIADFKPYCGNEADWRRVYDAIALLKAQEPVEPQEKREGDYRSLYCGACGRGIVGYVAHLTGIHVKLNDYCCKCGQAVKWDD